MSTHKVVIIGGGVAGLTAAKTLSDKQVSDFIILEASDRLGGRVYSDAERGIELGGEYIHGEGTILWDILVNQLKIPLEFNHDTSKETPKECGSALIVDGKMIQVNHSISEELDEIFEQFMFDEELKSSKEDMSVKEWLIWRKIPGKFHSLIDSTLAQENATCIEWYSAKGAQEDLIADSENDIGEGNYFIKGNNTMEHVLIPYLVKDIKQEQIKMNYNVKSIDYSSNLIKINGGDIICEKIILTVPLTILRNNLIEFTPDLTPLKRQLIQNQFDMHGGCKIILYYERPFWKKLFPHVNVVCDGDDDPIISQFWFSSTSEEQCEKFGHVITGFSMSNRAKNGYGMGEEKIKEHFRKLIQNLCRLTNENDGYLGGIVKNWKDIQHVGGAYAFHSITEASRRNYVENPREILSQPIESRIYFAGELYSSKSPATIHGAMETGRDASLRLLEEL